MVVLTFGGWIGFCVFVGSEDGFVMPIENSWSIDAAVADVFKLAAVMWTAR